MDVREFNSHAWDRESEKGNPWTVPVDHEVIEAARRGDWVLGLTDNIRVPADWYPELKGCDVLCLASGGGQQGPILAAIGARVTVLDNSPQQLEGDRQVAEREGLDLRIVEGHMGDLAMFDAESFDLIFHPISNCFTPDVRPVWNESFRVLRGGGVLLAGFCSPVNFIFDTHLLDQGEFKVRHRIPYSDLSLSSEERERTFGKDAPLEFGHSLDDQIGGQLEAGFHLTGFYEDRRTDDPLAEYIPTYMATRAVKP